jgi:hypothetical protein
MTKRLFLKMVGIDLNVLLPFSRNVVFRENGLHGAFVDAQAAVNAGVGVDVEHVGAAKFRLILAGMDAIDGAHRDAGGVFRTGAGLGNNVWHTATPRTLATIAVPACFEPVNYRETPRRCNGRRSKVAVDVLTARFSSLFRNLFGMEKQPLQLVKIAYFAYNSAFPNTPAKRLSGLAETTTNP